VGEEEEEEAQQDGKKTITTRGTYGKNVITINYNAEYIWLKYKDTYTN